MQGVKSSSYRALGMSVKNTWFQKQRHATRMTVICEGIETREQEDMLRSCGCDQGQGYLYGKPMPEEEFERFLLQHI